MAKITDRFIFKEIEHGIVADGVIFVTGPPKVKKHDLIEEITKKDYVGIDMSDTDISIFSQLNPRAFIRSIPPYSLLKNIDEVDALADEFCNLVQDLRIKYRGYFPNIFMLVSSIANPKSLELSTKFQASARKIFVPPLLAAEIIPYGDVNFLHNIFNRTYYPDQIKDNYNLDEIAIKSTFPSLISDKQIDKKLFFYEIFKKYLDKYFKDKESSAKFQKFINILAENIGHSPNERKITKDLDISSREYSNYMEIIKTTNLFFLLDQWSPGGTRPDPIMLYVIDTNLALYLLNKERLKECKNYEKLLYNFISAELYKQTNLSRNYKLYHFQKYETCPADFIIEHQFTAEIIPINIVFKEFVGPEDLAKIESFKIHAHQSCNKAFILYKGSKIVRLRPNILAIPIASLWHSGET